jgi:MFS transporter, FSR family, fosmidomycin resistance protein
VSQTATAPRLQPANTAFTVLSGISLSHGLNDLIQSLLPAIYPILKGGFDLNFAQIGLITMAWQLTASLLQPVVGLFTDKRPQPYSLPIGMCASMAGLFTLAFATNFAMLLIGAALLGTGSSIFHPEATRIARAASGGKHGLAQSMFQVGGNAGQAFGPLLAAFVILPYGKASMAWFALAAILAIVILTMVSRWYVAHPPAVRRRPAAGHVNPSLTNTQVNRAIAVLLALIFSKFFYLASITSYYTFYLIHHFGMSTQNAQIDLFVFLAAAAAGTFVGGPIGDRIGRKAVIWGSILGVLPFTLVMPYASLPWTIGLSIVIGLVLSSAFSAILVYAQELMPGRVGMVSGMFFGFAFGMAGLGAAVLGELADWTSIDFVYRICAFLPLIGLMTALLPEVEAPTTVGQA